MALTEKQKEYQRRFRRRKKNEWIEASAEPSPEAVRRMENYRKFINENRRLK